MDWAEYPAAWAAFPDIIYTKVDEAPQIARHRCCRSSAFASPAGITVGTKDISLAGRIIAPSPNG
jgi:isocitrate dehydrogenase